MPMYFFTRSGCSRSASEIGMKITPAFLSSAWNVVATETESNTASTATLRLPLPARFAIGVEVFRLVLDHARQNLLLAQRNAELLVGPENFRVDLVERLRAGLLLRRRVVIEVLVVDLVVVDPRPVRLLHGEPAAIGVETPRQHPFRLVLLGRNEPDGVLGKALRGLVGFDVGDEPVLVLVDVDAANPLDRLLHCRHSSLRSRGQGPWVGLSVMVGSVFPGGAPFA